MVNIRKFSNTNANFAKVLKSERRGKKQRRRDNHVGKMAIKAA